MFHWFWCSLGSNLYTKLCCHPIFCIGRSLWCKNRWWGLFDRGTPMRKKTLQLGDKSHCLVNILCSKNYTIRYFCCSPYSLGRLAGKFHCWDTFWSCIRCRYRFRTSYNWDPDSRQGWRLLRVSGRGRKWSKWWKVVHESLSLYKLFATWCDCRDAVAIDWRISIITCLAFIVRISCFAGRVGDCTLVGCIADIVPRVAFLTYSWDQGFAVRVFKRWAYWHNDALSVERKIAGKARLASVSSCIWFAEGVVQKAFEFCTAVILMIRKWAFFAG